MAKALFVIFALLSAERGITQVVPPTASEERFVADIELQTADQFRQLLERAETLLVEGVAPQDDEPTVTFVLHGPVIKDLLRQNYVESTELVNLAASLSALQVIEIKACRTWMGVHDVPEGDLQPFVTPVNLWRSELERLRTQEGYLDF
ncbi:MAG: hypothetical protein AAGF57_18180 [Pseudomonadota bacterium]